jgi:hypothetical protein
MSDPALREFYRNALCTDAVKALSLTQPYATLCALRAKRIETRSWRVGQRHYAPILLHAATGFPRDEQERCRTEPFRSVLMHHLTHGLPNRRHIEAVIEALPRGAIVGIATLYDVRWTGDAGAILPEDWLPAPESQERAFGNYAPRRYGWFLKNAICLPTPIPARGRLGLWTPDAALLEEVIRVLKGG